MVTVPQRIVVKETVYFQQSGSPAISVSSGFTRHLTSDEVPYQRPKIKVGEAWQKIETGWLEKASTIVIENPHEHRKTIPTPAEVEAAKARVLEIGVDYGEGPPLVAQCCPPGESVRINPPHSNASALRMRCVGGGGTVVNLTALPE